MRMQTVGLQTVGLEGADPNRSKKVTGKKRVSHIGKRPMWLALWQQLFGIKFKSMHCRHQVWRLLGLLPLLQLVHGDNRLWWLNLLVRNTRLFPDGLVLCDHGPAHSGQAVSRGDSELDSGGTLGSKPGQSCCIP